MAFLFFFGWIFGFDGVYIEVVQLQQPTIIKTVATFILLPVVSIRNVSFQ